ncbi:MAG: hypothetical protein AAFV95_16545 [Bacteroidota bacterium]
MCRYAYKSYKSHFVCFDCRKSFKKPPIEDLAMKNGDWENYKKAFWDVHSDKRKKFVKENPTLVRELEERYKYRKEKCPDCGQLMQDLGLDFKAPKKHKIKEWEIVRGMYRTGVNFHTCGCHGIGYVPKTKNKYIDYLKGRRAYYQERIEKKDVNFYKESWSVYIGRFAELIHLIDEELAKIK